MITFRNIPNKVVNNYPHNIHVQIIGHEYYYLQDACNEGTHHDSGQQKMLRIVGCGEVENYIDLAQIETSSPNVLRIEGVILVSYRT